MTLSFKSGDMFLEPVEALVNTVNCVGVMGKGVALEFKRRWPENFRQYKKLCDNKLLRPGKVFVSEQSKLFKDDTPKFIINFPTKAHWKTKSKLEYIDAGLDSLVEEISNYSITSLAMPPLGCGNGGLDWSDVRPLIVEKLQGLHGVKIVIFEPARSFEQPEHRISSFPMTYERAVLLKSLGDLSLYFGDRFDRISLQKIVYLLQSIGVDFKLSFSRNLFGPYSETLRQALLAFERFGLIAGFASEERLSRVTPSGYAIADDFLNARMLSENANRMIEKLDHLIEGYESPYGLELLSSVHLLAHGEQVRPLEKVIEAMNSWNEVKRNKFSDIAIRSAYERIEGDGLLH